MFSLELQARLRVRRYFFTIDIKRGIFNDREDMKDFNNTGFMC